MAGLELCKHIYEITGQNTCPDCGRPTHEIDWKEQTELARKWKEENPNAAYGGWWSI